MCWLCIECFVGSAEQTANFALYIFSWFVFITVLESVYSTVRTNSLYKADYVSSLNGCAYSVLLPYSEYRSWLFPLSAGSIRQNTNLTQTENGAPSENWWKNVLRRHFIKKEQLKNIRFFTARCQTSGAFPVVRVYSRI